MRDDEAGIPLQFSGRFTDTDGNPIHGAQMEIWHADDAGFYSQYAPGLPDWLFRGNGRLTTKAIRHQHHAPGSVPDPH